jgi:hypothetical protein
MYSDYINLVDKKASGVAGGNSVSGAWHTRDITDELQDTGNICSLAANQFTLETGTYRCLISASAFRTTWHQIRLYNITDGALELLGTSEWNEDSFGRAQTRSFCEGRFTIAAQKTFEIQYRVLDNRIPDGLGVPNNWGDNIYTVVELWRET